MTVTTSRARRTKKVKLPIDPQSFNSEYQKDEEEITKIFHHLFSRYPLGDGKKDAFNRLFVGLYEMRVFQRWSVARVVRAEVKRRTGSTAKATAVFKKLQQVGNDGAEKIALEMGINLKAKRGQFLYKWIEQILGHEYLVDGLHMRRYTRLTAPMSYAEGWEVARREAGYIPWAVRALDSDGESHYEGAGAWGVPANHESRLFPHFEDEPLCVGQHTCERAMESPLRDAIEAEVLRGIHEDTNETDRVILTKRSEGYTVREIQEHLSTDPGLKHYSHQGIANRLNALRTKPTTRAVLAR